MRRVRVGVHLALSAGSISAGATDRAIVIRPTEEVEA